MSGERLFQNNLLAQEVTDCFKNAFSNVSAQILPITQKGMFEDVKTILGMDYRCTLNNETQTTASVLDGVNFDPQRLRAQAFAIVKENQPVGLITIIIEPRKYYMHNKYLRFTNETAQLVNFPDIWHASPDYIITPGYAKSKEDHRGEYAIPGVRALLNTFLLLKAKATSNTWVEISVQGCITPEQRKLIIQIIKEHKTGESIEKYLPFIDPSLLGKSNPTSQASKKFAQYLGLQLAQNIVNLPTLGPVYSRDIVSIKSPL